MALTGLDIYKLLPKTNCGECGTPTCLAFAMALAGKKTSLDKCPHVSAQAKTALESASAPPIQLVTIGTGPNKLEIGNETVMFRHEQTFYHPCGIAIEIPDNLPADEIKKRTQTINNLIFDRVGKKIHVELIALRDVSHNPDTFANAVKTITASSQLALVLVSFNPGIIEAGLKICASAKPLIYAANQENYQAMAELAKKYDCPLGAAGKNLDDLSDLTVKITALGVKNLVIDPGSADLYRRLNDITQIRKLALKKTFRPFGFPIITFTPENISPEEEPMYATVFIAKYTGIVVVKGRAPWQILPLITLRLNIYTDPQKPIQIESKIYEIGAVTASSPVLVTTNFSLTYFTVEPEIEGSKVPSYILVVNTEGMSVLTAYAADKLNEKVITKALNDYNVKSKVTHKKVIIPGYISAMSGKLEAESGWEVMVGPREASGIPTYLKNVWK
ncbi:MAG: acetyl-CoA decarbonylase/synthase complex subunit gamma [Planctomycetota bacterium]